jgi:hypothetical protein
MRIFRFEATWCETKLALAFVGMSWIVAGDAVVVSPGTARSFG